MAVGAPKTAPVVLDEAFAHIYRGVTRDAWGAILVALFGPPATEAEAAVIRDWDHGKATSEQG